MCVWNCFFSFLLLHFLLTAPQSPFFICSAHTPLSTPAVGVLWITMTTSWEAITWPTCASQAWQATPPAPCFHSCLWAYVGLCVNAMCFWWNVWVIKALILFLPAPSVKPDPPSEVSVRQEEGQEMRITVTWSFPISWKSQDSFYKLIYEIKYRPLKSFDHWQVHARVFFICCVFVCLLQFSRSIYC